MSPVVPLLAGFVLSVGASCFFSGIETGVYTLNRVRLELRAEEGDRAARRMAGLLRRPEMLISAILVGNHLANFLASYFCQSLVMRYPVTRPEVVNTLVLTPFLFVFGELLPKNLFRARADGLVYPLSGVLRGACVLFRPAAAAFRWLGRVSRALPSSPAGGPRRVSRKRLRGLLRELLEEGQLSPGQLRMAQNVLRITTVRVEEAMVPLEDVDRVDRGAGREELLAASRAHGRTRIPVRDPRSGELVGVVNVLDLVFRPGKGMEELVRPVPSIPAGTTVDRALGILRRARQPLGFVRGAGGRAVGIITLKDLVEEISGDLPAF